MPRVPLPPESRPGIPNPWDTTVYDPYEPPDTGGGGSTGCGPGTVPESIGADGNWRTAQPGECIPEDEFRRRVDLNIRNNPNPGGGGNKGGNVPTGPVPTAPKGPATYKFDPVPDFDAPEFTWDEMFKAPSLDDARNEPGYAFAANEGSRALEQSKAAKGTLLTGGSLKDILSWGNQFGEQNYSNVFDRYARGYDTRFNTAKDKFAFKYQGAKDEYSPKLFEWQTKTAFGTNAAQEAWRKQWDQYMRDTLTAADILNAGQRRY